MARSRNHSLIVAAMALLLGLALCSCGTSAPTKQDVIARGDAICETAAGAVRSLPSPGQTMSGLADYFKRATPIVEQEVARLRALPRPAEDRTLLDRYLTALKASITSYRSLALAAARGDGAGVAQATAALRDAPVASLAARYGLSRCAAAAGTRAS